MALLGAEWQRGGPGDRSQCNPCPTASVQCAPFLNLSSPPCIRIVSIYPPSPIQVKGSHAVTAFPPLRTFGRQSHTVNSFCSLANLWEQRGGWAHLSPPLTTQRRKPREGTLGGKLGTEGCQPSSTPSVQDSRQMESATRQMGHVHRKHKQPPPEWSVQGLPNHRRHVGRIPGFPSSGRPTAHQGSAH